MNKEEILAELTFKASLSGGKGGQHVNKVASKVSLFLDVENSRGLDRNEKDKVREKLKGFISNEGILILHCDEGRSQFKNKKIVVSRLFQKLQHALKQDKKRIKLTPTKAMVRKRLKEKKKLGEKKGRRREDKKLGY